MVALGFTVTFVRRRQVPNTYRPRTSCRLQYQALVMLIWTQSLPYGGVLKLSWLTCPPDRPASPSTAMHHKLELLLKLPIIRVAASTNDCFGMYTARPHRSAFRPFQPAVGNCIWSLCPHS